MVVSLVDGGRLRVDVGGNARSPEEIAKSALYLASDASTFTMGTALLVDGGGVDQSKLSEAAARTEHNGPTPCSVSPLL